MIHNDKTVIEVERSLAEHAVKLFVFRSHAGGDLSIYLPMADMEKIELGAVVAPHKPTIVLTFEEAQSLMDELWIAGIRPEGHKHPDGQIEAMRDHIEDLRKAFNKLMGVD